MNTTITPVTVSVATLEHADGRPIAYVDATAIAVFTYQDPDGTYVIDVHTRDDSADGRLRLLVDGRPSGPVTGGH